MEIEPPRNRDVAADEATRASYSWRALMVGGIALVGVGMYFLFLRPPLLPEDARYMGLPLAEVLAAVPGLVAFAAARAYLKNALRHVADCFDIEVAIRVGTSQLRGTVITKGGIPIANDTSFGAGYAPYSRLRASIDEGRLQCLVQAQLDSIPSLSMRLARGEVRVF